MPKLVIVVVPLISTANELIPPMSVVAADARVTGFVNPLPSRSCAVNDRA